MISLVLSTRPGDDVTVSTFFSFIIGVDVTVVVVIVLELSDVVFAAVFFADLAGDLLLERLLRERLLERDFFLGFFFCC